MRYILTLAEFGIFVYLLSFASFNWKNKNKMAAIGTIIIALLSLTMPFLG